MFEVRSLYDRAQLQGRTLAEPAGPCAACSATLHAARATSTRVCTESALVNSRWMNSRSFLLTVNACTSISMLVGSTTGLLQRRLQQGGFSLELLQVHRVQHLLCCFGRHVKMLCLRDGSARGWVTPRQHVRRRVREKIQACIPAQSPARLPSLRVCTLLVAGLGENSAWHLVWGCTNVRSSGPHPRPQPARHGRRLLDAAGVVVERQGVQNSHGQLKCFAICPPPTTSCSMGAPCAMLMKRGTCLGAAGGT